MKSPRSIDRRGFPSIFWLVILFEFFERGAYYGMMSFLSVYLTDKLHFAKPDVGVLKATLQSLLYFLPILSGAIADRFGYRRVLLCAFGLLGGGYFLTARTTQYASVFLSLMVVGLGAGAFKPIISGCIARCTDESNSSLGFGIYYWSINLGAFLVPLLLVPYLRKNFGLSWAIMASAIGTGAMLIPALLFFREPRALRSKPEPPPGERRPGLLQTLADALEIIYSPFVLLAHLARSSGRGASGRLWLWLILGGLLAGGAYRFLCADEQQIWLAAPGHQLGKVKVVSRLHRHLGKPAGYELQPSTGEQGTLELVIYDPDHLERFADELLGNLRGRGAVGANLDWLRKLRAQLEQRVILAVSLERGLSSSWDLQTGTGWTRLRLRDVGCSSAARAAILQRLHQQPGLDGLLPAELDDLLAKLNNRPFLLLFVALLLGASLLVLRLQPVFRAGGPTLRVILVLGTVAAWTGLLWSMPFISTFTRVLGAIIGSSVVALYAMDTREEARFRDHFRFLLMIFIYSGFWVIYFQMFDSVLWYVQAYVDPSKLEAVINAMLAGVGVRARWHFDVEHVTVINGGTIILLQLLISTLVRNKRALPTMIVGIGFGTLGMAILSLSTGIGVFIVGMMIFSIGEMTAHPKFIAYVGQIAPKSRTALYMGYVSLYGVIGSSIGAVAGAHLYVRFVDERGQPRVLWLIFAGIGAATMFGLLLFHRFTAAPPRERIAQ